jgi:hypothetical protein
MFVASLAMALFGCRLSGKITSDDGVPVPGVTLTLSGAAGGTAVTDSDGYYEFDVPNTTAGYRITPTLDGYGFDPEYLDVAFNGNNIDGLDFKADKAAGDDFGDITYYHNCDTAGEPMIHKGESDLYCTMAVRDYDPVDGTPFWSKYPMFFPFYATELRQGNFPLEEGRIGLFSRFNEGNTEPQQIVGEPDFSESGQAFSVTVDNGTLEVVYRGGHAAFENVIPVDTWFFLELKFTMGTAAVFIDGMLIGTVEGSDSVPLPDMIEFSGGTTGSINIDQIMASNDSGRNLYGMRFWLGE